MNEWDQCLDPYHEAVEIGRQEGYESGLQSGYQEGYHIGKVKALEIGIELGYMQSIAQQALNDLYPTGAESYPSSTIVHSINESTTSREHRTSLQEKPIKTKQFIQDLLQCITQFPSPDEMFSSTSIDGGDQHKDIMEVMQRLRAKFKVLLIQMKLPHLTLKKVMNDSPVMDHESSLDSEW